MRTSKFFKTGLLLFVASLGLISCGDDDKEPEIVVDPVSENVEYYIEEEFYKLKYCSTVVYMVPRA